MPATLPNPSSEAVAPASLTHAEMGERRFRSVNCLGLWTLYCREVRRFAKIPTVTIVSPVITSLLFLFIFTFAIGYHRLYSDEVSFMEFLIPGLVMMFLIQTAFSSVSFLLLHSKLMGDVVDVLMAPLSPGELTLAFVAAGTTSGIVVSFCVMVTMMVFQPIPPVHMWAVLYFGIGASMMLGQMGLLAGIWSEKYDHLQSIINFAITPLSFLSGTFYPISVLPYAGQALSHGNPFFYLIDGFRYGFIGNAESNVAMGVAIVAMLNIVLWVLCYLAFRSGWRLKS